MNRWWTAGLVIAMACGGGDDPTCEDADCVEETGHSEVETDTDVDTDTDIPVETDTDVDSDSDTDGETDTDGDTDTDTDPPGPLAGFGDVTGDCWVLDDTEWLSSGAFRFRTTVDFGMEVFEASLLSPGGQEILTEGTLGGSSVNSEAIAYDLLYRCEGASLELSESEIVYTDAGGKKTDMLVTIDGRAVGVSVTRALTFSQAGFCSAPNATNLQALLERKVGDLALSEANAHPDNPWERSVLSVIACDDAHADLVESLFDGLDAAVRGDAILLVAVTDGADAFIYSN